MNQNQTGTLPPLTTDQMKWVDSMLRVCPRPDRIALATALLAAGQPETAREDKAWILHYADQDVQDEWFSGVGAEGAARARFELQRNAWTCTLFKEVAHG